MALKRYQILIITILLNSPLLIGQQKRNPVSTLKVTTLSTMVVNGKGVGEWGYSALVEVRWQENTIRYRSQTGDCFAKCQ